MSTYINTDLDLSSSADLTGLVAALESRGLFALHVTHADDGLWHATLETAEQHSEPEPNIAAIIAAAESLPESHRLSWHACSRCTLDIGYECASAPSPLHHAISNVLLARSAAVGASLAFTLYSSAAAP